MSGGPGAGRTGGPADEDLGQVLATGLARAAGGDVDGDALVRGAHTGARRIRRRRAAARGVVAAVVVVGLVPVGFSALGGGGLGRGTATTAAGGAAASEEQRAAAGDGGSAFAASSAPEAGPAAPRAASSASSASKDSARTLVEGAPPRVLARTGADVVVPETALLAGTDLGLSAVSVVTSTAGRGSAALDVPLCPGGLPGDEVVAGGRAAGWAGEARGGSWQVATAVRVLSGDGATRRVAALRAGAAGCVTGGSVEPWSVPSADEAVVVVLPSDGSGDARAVGVVRRGRTTADVEVVVPAGGASGADARRSLAVDRVRTLLDRAAVRLGDLAARADADPTLG